MRVENFKEYLKKARASRVPYAVHLILTKKCNFKCVHCNIIHSGKNDASLKLEDWKNFFRELKKAGVFKLSFSGGEPLKLPFIFDLIKYASRLKFQTELFTNGALLNDEKINLLNKYKVHTARVSYYSDNKKIFHSLTRSLCYEKVKENIKKLKELFKGEIIINIPVIKKNLKSYETAVDFARGLNLNYIVDYNVSADMAMTTTPLKHRVPVKAAAEIFLKHRDFFTAAEKAGFKKNTPDKKNSVKAACSPAGASFTADFQGNLYPCYSLFIPFGNFLYDDISSLFRNSPVLNILNKKVQVKNKCFECPQIKMCMNCPSQAMIENNNFFKGASDYNCRLTKRISALF